MSTSLVHKNGYGFWCPDWLLEVFAHSVGTVLLSHPDEGAQELGVELVGKSTAGLVGCLDLGLDLLTPDQETLVQEAVREVEQGAHRCPERLSSECLNGLGLSTRFSDGIQAVHWSRICDAVVMLLMGKWRATAGDQEAAADRWLYSDHG